MVAPVKGFLKVHTVTVLFPPCVIVIYAIIFQSKLTWYKKRIESYGYFVLVINDHNRHHCFNTHIEEYFLSFFTRLYHATPFLCMRDNKNTSLKLMFAFRIVLLIFLFLFLFIFLVLPIFVWYSRLFNIFLIPGRHLLGDFFRTVFVKTVGNCFDFPVGWDVRQVAINDGRTWKLPENQAVRIVLWKLSLKAMMIGSLVVFSWFF